MTKEAKIAEVMGLVHSLVSISVAAGATSVSRDPALIAQCQKYGVDIEYRKDEIMRKLFSLAEDTQ